MNWLHILPKNDDKSHKDIGLDCPCNPRIDWNNMLVIHNAWDFRELKENKTYCI
jgi:hypothetical protein